jgi:hypothetical protein
MGIALLRQVSFLSSFIICVYVYILGGEIFGAMLTLIMIMTEPNSNEINFNSFVHLQY